MLADKYRWDYWQVQALPVDYVEELICMLNATSSPAEDTAGEVTPDWIAAKRTQHAMKIKRYFA